MREITKFNIIKDMNTQYGNFIKTSSLCYKMSAWDRKETLYFDINDLRVKLQVKNFPSDLNGKRRMIIVTHLFYMYNVSVVTQ